VLNRPGFDDEAGNHDRPFESQLAPDADGPPVHDAPRCRRRVDGTRGSEFQPAGMIRMPVRDKNGRRSQIAHAAEPIFAAVNEHATPSCRQEHRRMPSMLG